MFLDHVTLEILVVTNAFHDPDPHVLRIIVSASSSSMICVHKTHLFATVVGTHDFIRCDPFWISREILNFMGCRFAMKPLAK